MYAAKTLAERRAQLAKAVGFPILLFGNLERPGYRFVQDSNFFYFTERIAPGLVCLIMPDGETTIFEPRYEGVRSFLMGVSAPFNVEDFPDFQPLGEPFPRHSVTLFDAPSCWGSLCERLAGLVGGGAQIATVFEHEMWLKMRGMVPSLQKNSVSCAPQIASMRRQKCLYEQAGIFSACGVTKDAHELAAGCLRETVSEGEILARMLYAYTRKGASEAFSTTITTALEVGYADKQDSDRKLHAGECVVITSGARFDQYCADVTRTYPVSGSFTKRQREVYEAVFSTQRALAEELGPGWWFRNDDEPSHSIYHRVQKLLDQYGLARFLVSDMGCFVGLDVPDVGDVAQSFRTDDVVAIDLGLYLPDEGLAVRIGDVFQIIPGTAICLTENLPSAASDIEEFMRISREKRVFCTEGIFK